MSPAGAVTNGESEEDPPNPKLCEALAVEFVIGTSGADGKSEKRPPGMKGDVPGNRVFEPWGDSMESSSTRPGVGDEDGSVRNWGVSSSTLKGLNAWCCSRSCRAGERSCSSNERPCGGESSVPPAERRENLPFKPGLSRPFVEAADVTRITTSRTATRQSFGAEEANTC
jgi:hypothetical protein